MPVEWEKCFDVGILPGRVLQVLLMHDKTTVADATMRLEVRFRRPQCLFKMGRSDVRLISHRRTNVRAGRKPI